MRRAALALAVGLVAAGPGAGGEKAPPTKRSPETAACEAVRAASATARSGREAKCPLCLLAAAGVLGKTDFRKLDLTGAKVESKAEEVDPLKEADDLIREAVKLAGDDAGAVKKLAEAVRKDLAEVARGAVPGPRSFQGVSPAGGGADDFPITFRGGEPALIDCQLLTNKGDIDLFVYLGKELVASDRRLDDDTRVFFRPPRRPPTRWWSGATPARARSSGTG